MDRLNSLKEAAYRAYANTSFSPERRRDQILKELEEELEQDLKELGDNAGNYEEKYIDHVSTWLSRKSRCISVMITGSANFPVRRNQKANSAEDKAFQDFVAWRNRYFKAVNRVSNLSPEDDMEQAIKKVDKLMINQEIMKAVNKIIRTKNITNKQKVELIIEAGLPEPGASEILNSDCVGTIGFASFTLTNNNAKIKSAKQKILIMKNRIAVKASFEPILFEGGQITIDNDRVCITHDEKPEREVIDRIRLKGFHWSRNYKSWSRKHTVNALYDAKEIMGVK